MNDVLTVARKELGEILLQRNTVRGGVLVSLIIPIGLLGVFLPLQEGPQWVTSAVAPLLWTWMPVFMVATMICDAFAGERERHTLETLLATRLSDGAILFGKIAAAVAYGWGLALAGVILSLITVNAAYGRGGWLMFPPAALAAIVVLGLLGSSLAAGGGVLVSLRAATVRQAQQTVGLALMVLTLGIGFGAKALPAAWQEQIVQYFTGASLIRTEFVLGAALLAADLALIAAARARFRRARLLLD